MKDLIERLERLNETKRKLSESAEPGPGWSPYGFGIWHRDKLDGAHHVYWIADKADLAKARREIDKKYNEYYSTGKYDLLGLIAELQHIAEIDHWTPAGRDVAGGGFVTSETVRKIREIHDLENS